MPTRSRLALGEVERTTREQLRDRGPRAYLRERAAVLLAIAAGASIRGAARTAGLHPHDADTVCDWVGRYRAEGLAGLWIRKGRGRGRKPATFPARAD